MARFRLWVLTAVTLCLAGYGCTGHLSSGNDDAQAVADGYTPESCAALLADCQDGQQWACDLVDRLSCDAVLDSSSPPSPGTALDASPGSGLDGGLAADGTAPRDSARDSAADSAADTVGQPPTAEDFGPLAPPGATWKGVSPTMWAEIEAQRVAFNDPNDCQARVASIPTSGYELAPCSGSCINDALSSQGTVFLQGGTYKISGTLNVGSKKLIGAAGQQVVIDASGVKTAAKLGAGVIANVTIIDAEDFGISFGSDGLAYQVAIARTGYNPAPNGTGDSFAIYSGSHNCIVSTEAYDGYNESGGDVTDDGGQANGYTFSTGATYENTVIDSHSYRNSDDGFDCWEGGTVYIYFCSAFENGKTPGKASGDGVGVKLGRGSAKHYVYKTESYDNLTNGFDINGNSVKPTLIQCDAWGNGGQDYVGVTNSN